MPPWCWPAETSSTMPLIVQPGIVDAPSETEADLAKPPAGAVSKSPLVSKPVVQEDLHAHQLV
jgi:hypothetical protein